MDTSEEYVRMCEEACDIQEGHVWVEGDFVWRGCDEGYEKSFMIHHSNDAYDGDVWLPRQDQLQDMIEQPSSFAKMAVMIEETCEVAGLGHIMIKPRYYICSGSMERLWLGYVMKKRHGKVWTGREWSRE